MLTNRQRQVAELVARGLSDKQIARSTGISVDTVKWHLREAASRIPVDGPRRHRCYVWFFNLRDESESDAA